MKKSYPMMAAALAGLILMPAPSAFAAPQSLEVVAPVKACGDLLSLDLTQVAGAGSAVATAAETTSDGIAVCNVEGTLAPAIAFQVILPLQTWTQRYLQVGCGGLCGSITLRSGASAGCPVLNDGGFVMAATDMGHEGNDPQWALDPIKRADFAYRAQHLTAQAAKALIAEFYGQAEKYAYFNGCSDGGREALMEAQRYPDDFDGIIAGAPAALFQVQNTLYHGWQARSNTAADGSVILTSGRLPLLYAAVMAACDGTDGLEDGLISQPAACAFDPASIQCPAGASDTSACLTAAEVDTVRKLYAGPQDQASGAYLTAGQPLPGSELEWQGVFVADNADQPLFSRIITDPVLKFIAYDKANPEFGVDDLQFTAASLDAARARHPLFDATNPDLSAFAAGGGKLILWHGLSDQHIAPANTVSYHKALIGQLGEQAVEGFERFYLLPGVGHCGGGRGPANVDMLSAVLDWVESGAAPDGLMTATTAETSSFGQPDQPAGQARQGGPERMAIGPQPLPDMTRPVYPYPYVAAFSGSGEWTDGANWKKGAASEIVATRTWPGENLFTPYEPVVVNQ